MSRRDRPRAPREEDGGERPRRAPAQAGLDEQPHVLHSVFVKGVADAGGEIGSGREGEMREIYMSNDMSTL